MRITALPAPFHRAANIRLPDISPTAVGRLNSWSSGAPFAPRDIVPAAMSCRWERRRPPRAPRGSSNAIVERIPFPVKAIQVDGGSEWRVRGGAS